MKGVTNTQYVQLGLTLLKNAVNGADLKFCLNPEDVEEVMTALETSEYIIGDLKKYIKENYTLEEPPQSSTHT